MATVSAIEWTDKTWNPVVGCTRASKGCDNCYAATMARRLDFMAQADIQQGKNPGRKIHYMDTAVKTQSGRIAFNGHINLVPEALNDPFSWKKPSKIFVNSMSDLFHTDVPFDYVDRVFAVIAATPQHTYQILTKRPERMLEWYERPEAAPYRDLQNAWKGTSVEDQEQADKRIPYLVRVPGLRFLSCEPLLGAVNVAPYLPQPVGESWAQEVMLAWGEDIGKIHWIIAGGESGPNARPSHPNWFRCLRDQAQAAGVAFFFKQHGAYIAESQVNRTTLAELGIGRAHFGTLGSDGQFIKDRYSEGFNLPDQEAVYLVGKKAAGNLLDGVEWKQLPEPVEA